MKASGKNKKMKWKKEFRDWGIIIAIFGILYLTGLHTEVIGRLQGLVLKTGLLNPEFKTIENPIPLSHDFSLINLRSGEEVKFSSFNGKTILLNFWASWCPPCVAELPSLEKLYEDTQHDSTLVILLINLDDDSEKAGKFMQRKNIQAPVYRLASPIPRELYSQTIPTTFIISPQSQIVFVRKGAMNFSSKSFKQFLRAISAPH